MSRVEPSPLHKITLTFNHSDFLAIQEWLKGGGGNVTLPVAVRALALTNPIIQSYRSDAQADEALGIIDRRAQAAQERHEQMCRIEAFCREVLIRAQGVDALQRAEREAKAMSEGVA